MVNKNISQTYLFTAPDYGNYTVHLDLLGFPAGTYYLNVSSPLDVGTSSPFVLRYAQYLNIASPNSTTNVSNTGTLGLGWNPSNPAVEMSSFSSTKLSTAASIMVHLIQKMTAVLN